MSVRLAIAFTLLLAIGVSFGAGATASQKAPLAPATRSVPATRPFGFRANVKIEATDKAIIVKSDGIPDHTTGDFPNARNPNRILKQDYTFTIPLHPVKADKITPLPMGPIGVAINGVPFYNPYNAEGADAAKNEVFDECCGHPDPMGRYHYHIYPKCIHTSFEDKPGEHSPLIGYAFDGYAIYGPNGEDGKPPTDLDECNGHTDPIRGYHYHVTDHFPYILGGYRGVVENANFDHGTRDAQGRPMDARGNGGNGLRGNGPPPRGPGGPGRGPPPFDAPPPPPPGRRGAP